MRESNPCIVLTDEASDGIDRHFAGKGHNVRFKQQSERTSRPGPRERSRLNATRKTPYTRDTGMKIGSVLKEIQVASRSLFGIVYATVGVVTSRTGKVGPFGESKSDVDLLDLWIEVQLRGHPRICDT